MNRITWLDRLLPPFAEGRYEKPRDMLYIAPDRPSWSTTLNTAMQHTVVALMFMIYAVIGGQALGLEPAPLCDFMALGILVMGIGTVLNGLTTRLSPGQLLVKIPDPIPLTVFIVVVEAAGAGPAFGGLLAAGLLLLLLGRLLPMLRVLIPAEVTGVVILLLGLSLIRGGIQRAVGWNSDGGDTVDLDSVVIAVATLLPMIGVSAWSTGRSRLFAVAIGVGVGLIMAVANGQLTGAEWQQLAAQPIFALPGALYRPPAPTWELAAVIPLCLIAVVHAADQIGIGIMIDKMNHAQWTRSDLPMIGRLLSGTGCGYLLSALTGTLATGCSAANLGLAQVTGVAARRVAVVAGVLMMALAFLPQLTTLITLWPQGVVGAILIYTAAFMMVSGVELILSRLLNARRRVTVGLSLVAGSTVFIVPELTSRLSADLAPILGSGLMVGTLSALLLNLLFRIGVTQQRAIRLDEARPEMQAARFLENCGADWGARRDCILRAGLVIGEALEILDQTQVIEGPATLLARFDEYHLWLTLEYPGRAIELDPGQVVDARALLEDEYEEAAIDLAMAAISASMIRKLADRVDTWSGEGRAGLRLQFEH
jgi:xanthine/uracil permease